MNYLPTMAANTPVFIDGPYGPALSPGFLCTAGASTPFLMGRRRHSPMAPRIPALLGGGFAGAHAGHLASKAAQGSPAACGIGTALPLAPGRPMRHQRRLGVFCDLHKNARR